MAELVLDGVTKYFDDDGDRIVAVDDASIDIEDGEFLVLVGPSGCGKSTTLRMIAGLETVSEGEIRLDGTVINDRAPADRNIAMVFQSYALYPHMSVRQNMSFGLEESTSMGDSEIGQRVEDAADTMDIPELLDRKPSELSGGQQQRVALGRAIVRDPEVFLMDEPLSNLDAKLRSSMRTELQRIQEELGVTTVYVTHDQTEAMTMGDRIAILNDGRLQQVATPLEAYHEPANEFVAGFIGDPSMNFFDATVEDGALVTDQFDYPLSEATLADLDGETDVTLGVRPEDIEIVPEATGDHDFAATVDVVEPLGNENNVYLQFDADDTDTTFTAVVDATTPLSAGESVTARIPEETVHVFDADSGDALHNRDAEANGVLLGQ
ncbi:ABC-type transport system ATP-binding protein (probable substrate sugar) [Halobacterium hubeiense]|uniref:ABC-type D-xylose/L-arabinose transporter n=1 Tax=Halobacterium hubeiense TaxID=1407499 RepID=A0A0U5H415_9EURY|nr:ABC transporter ATP-binding protein [Halobacterium hubeiense]CQH56160.1 ABC-type transport system ATP-binding protein (probable substrate sugar) [Halobacterium hubeiense]